MMMMRRRQAREAIDRVHNRYTPDISTLTFPLSLSACRRPVGFDQVIVIIEQGGNSEIRPDLGDTRGSSARQTRTHNIRTHALTQGTRPKPPDISDPEENQ
jgi:hypothetical protein